MSTVSDIAITAEQAQEAEEDARMAAAALIERNKMLRGEAYDGNFDPTLSKARLKARQHCYDFNTHPPAKWYKGIVGPECFGPDSRSQHLADLFDLPLETIKKGIMIEPPFYCDYGTNIHFSGLFYANFNLTILDGTDVTFGKRVLIAPNVQIYSATHSVDVPERAKGLDRAYPITIGDDCWIGGGAIICGPATIGNGCTIAAGAVVRGTFPDHCVIGGVPARILKKLDPETNVPGPDAWEV